MRNPDQPGRIEPSFGLGNRLGRVAWGLVQGTLFRWSPRPCHAWRAWLLRCFGATIGRGARVYAKAEIWAPWNLIVEDGALVADRVIVYSQGPIRIGAFATVSQGAHLCAGTHDHNDRAFPLITKPITIGPHAWVAAEAFIHPGVVIGEGSVIGARSVVTRDTAPWTVNAGFPARKISERERFTAE